MFATVLVAVVIIGARFAWAYSATYLPRFFNKRRRSLHLSAFLQEERDRDGDEHPDGDIPRPAGFCPLGHHLQGRQTVRSRRALDPHPAAPLRSLEYAAAEGSGCRTGKVADKVDQNLRSA